MTNDNVEHDVGEGLIHNLDYEHSKVKSAETKDNRVRTLSHRECPTEFMAAR